MVTRPQFSDLTKALLGQPWFSQRAPKALLGDTMVPSGRALGAL